MNARFRLAGLALCLCSGPALAAPAASAPAADAAREAGPACEAAVAESVRDMRGRDAQELQFMAEKRRLLPSSDGETSVKGEGRYRGGSAAFTSFTYRCLFNAATGGTTGVVFSETGGPRPQAAEKPWQPDLLNLSPEACETAVAAALKAKYPRVGRIAFGSDSRQLRPGPNGSSRLEGRGGLERAVGMHSIPFSYRCDYDSRSSKLIGVQTSE